MSEHAVDQYNIHEAKTQLSRIIERVEQGAQIVISRSGKPVAKVVPLRMTQRTGRERWLDGCTGLRTGIPRRQTRPLPTTSGSDHEATARHPCHLVVAV